MRSGRKGSLRPSDPDCRLGLVAPPSRGGSNEMTGTEVEVRSKMDDVDRKLREIEIFQHNT